MNMRNPIALFAAAAVLIVGLAMPGAVRADDFYAGKTLILMASSEPGAGYDSYTRLLGRHIQKYIPGAPSIVVQNEPGGGGLRVGETIYSVAEKDGTKVANLRASSLLDSILGIHDGYIDPNKYEWIGNMASDTDLCSFWSTASIHDFADLQNKEVIVGASGVGAQNYSFPNAINHVLHTKMKIILGYKGMGDRIVATERGELQGNCGINASSMISGYPQLISEGKLIPIMQSGLHPYSAFPDVPLTQSFATTDEQKKILVTIFSQMDIARVFAAPPGTPKDRVEILRKAFMQAMNDPQLVAEAKSMRLDLNPMSGADVAQVVAQMSNLPPELKAQVRTAVGD
jgi:tripartite-type tricarboxylate transporter receptor subunit TctC